METIEADPTQIEQGVRAASEQSAASSESIVGETVRSGQEMADAAVEFIAAYGMKVVAAILILVVGMWIARKVQTIFEGVLRKKNVEETLVGFFSNIIKTLIVVAVVIAAINKLGIQTTSLIAVVGAAGLAVGLALQGSLANFASGVLIIMFKPFKSGDFITAGGETGGVVEIGLLATELKTPDNKKIIVPNSAIMGGSITNFSAHPQRRVDMVVGVSYGDNLARAKQIIEEVIAADERILKDPAPQVAVAELADSSVNFVVRPWVDSANFWDVKFDFTQAIKERFDREGISIPFPQRDIHLFQESSSQAVP